jgi:carboxymethylenebutenolidase
MPINLAEEIAAFMTFYAIYPGLDYHGAKAAYLCHETSEDPYVSAESAVEMQQALGAAW